MMPTKVHGVTDWREDDHWSWGGRVLGDQGIVWIIYMDSEISQDGNKSWRRKENCGLSTDSSLNIGMKVSCSQSCCQPKNKAIGTHMDALTWTLYLHIWRCFSRALLSRKFSPSPYPTAPEQFHRVRILRKSCRRIFTMTSFILL